MTDALMNLYYTLAAQVEIPDMARYADDWSLLAAQFAADDRPAMAESCQGRYRQYARLAAVIPSAKRERWQGMVILSATHERAAREARKCVWR